jgi:hypothetical protein
VQSLDFAAQRLDLATQRLDLVENSSVALRQLATQVGDDVPDCFGSRPVVIASRVVGALQRLAQRRQFTLDDRVGPGLPLLGLEQLALVARRRCCSDRTLARRRCERGRLFVQQVAALDSDIGKLLDQIAALLDDRATACLLVLSLRPHHVTASTYWTPPGVTAAQASQPRTRIAVASV